MVTDRQTGREEETDRQTGGWVQVNRLGVVVGVERSLEDPCREDDAVLSGHVVGIDCGRSHAPPGGGAG